ncbi:MAG TPA: helix-turn-helix transcriptional regulator [Anaerolineaceae bacterium]
MDKNAQKIQIRSKKLGVLLVDARLTSRRSIEECAAVIGVTPEVYQDFEAGKKSPSLPELENLAYFFNIPLEHFWGKEAITAGIKAESVQDKERYKHLRNRIIGSSLAIAMNNQNITLKELAEKLGMPEDVLRKYQSGEVPPPLPELEMIAGALGVPIEQLFDQKGPVGQWRSQQLALKNFLELSPESQQFVSKPVNQPYLDLAIRLSEMPAEKLRAIAESLLEITY